MTSAAEAPTTDRIDMYGSIHKGLRRVLFDVALQAGRTDFGSPAETEALAGAIARCFDFLREHAEHEDRDLQPVLRRLAPALASALQTEHVELERASIAVEAMFPRLAGVDSADRQRLGREVFRRLNLLVADQLRHLEREEREANATLWSYLPDAELMAIRASIVGHISPERMAAWFDLVSPALTARERQLMAGK